MVVVDAGEVSADALNLAPGSGPVGEGEGEVLSDFQQGIALGHEV